VEDVSASYQRNHGGKDRSMKALLSVYDKTGLKEFAEDLHKLGWDLIASGGTAKVIQDAGLPVTDVAELVGGGAILDHRVVTLSREIHAGLLARDIPEDRKELEDLGIPFIDLVCVDLYPLQDEIANPDSTPDSVIQKTDIGGPTMLRSAAKAGRVVVADPADRQKVIDWLKADRPEAETFKRELAAKAEAIIADYCLCSARYHSHGDFDGIVGHLVLTCKYGENAPQTPAGLFSTNSKDPLSLDKFEVVAGTAPSYNNLCEVDRHLQTITHIAAGFEKNFGKVPLIAIGTKHGNPCGAAVGEDAAEVLKKMVTGDARAIFGGLVMTNFDIDEKLAETLLTHGMEGGRRLLDGIIAPSFTKEAIDMLGRKGDKCRFMVNPALSKLGIDSLDKNDRLRFVRGGFLRQPNYMTVIELKAAEKTGELAKEQEHDMILGWAIGSTSNSNTVTLVKAGQLIGNGVGQQDRVSCCQLAIKRAVDAGHEVKGAVAYSDSFFPFPDGPEVLADAGIAAIWSTTGSLKDKDTQDLCKERGVVLYQLPDSEARGFFGH
jgi:phosphoribosylaminoimidazolecarboxamide formyltransferase / IMP cyclohydrolase